MGVGLADDKVVDVEELLQPDHRQVRLQAAAAQRRRAIRIILVIIIYKL